jgi:hypothetical protein
MDAANATPGHTTAYVDMTEPLIAPPPMDLTGHALADTKMSSEDYEKQAFEALLKPTTKKRKIPMSVMRKPTIHMQVMKKLEGSPQRLAKPKGRPCKTPSFKCTITRDPKTHKKKTLASYVSCWFHKARKQALSHGLNDEVAKAAGSEAYAVAKAMFQKHRK